LADRRIEADARDVEEMPAAEVPHVERAALARKRPSNRGIRIFRNPERAAEPVAGSRSHDAERRRGADERRGRVVDGPVTAPRDDDLRAAVDEIARDGAGLMRSGRRDDIAGDAEIG